MSFSEATAGFLREWKNAQTIERLAAGPRWKDSGLVFTTKVGTPLDASTVTHRFQRFLTQNGLPKQRFHDLRHASASFLLVQGVPMKAVAERLGHANITLTLNTYAHLGAELQRQAADHMDRVLVDQRLSS